MPAQEQCPSTYTRRGLVAGNYRCELPKDHTGIHCIGSYEFIWHSEDADPEPKDVDYEQASRIMHHLTDPEGLTWDQRREAALADLAAVNKSNPDNVHYEPSRAEYFLDSDEVKIIKHALELFIGVYTQTRPGDVRDAARLMEEL